MALLSRARQLLKPSKWMRSRKSSKQERGSKKVTQGSASTTFSSSTTAVDTASDEALATHLDLATSQPASTAVLTQNGQDMPPTATDDGTSNTTAGNLAPTPAVTPPPPPPSTNETASSGTNTTTASNAVTTHNQPNNSTQSTNPGPVLFGPLPPVFSPPPTFGALSSGSLQHQLHVDLSAMTKFTALSGTVSNGNASPDDQAKVFRFSGASSTSEAREETKTSTGLGLIYGRSYADDMITLRVGPEATPFKVHMSMLTRASKVFHAMFKQQFQGATTREATLDDDDANAWGLIMDWLYTESLPEFDPLYLKSQATKRQRASGKQACSIGLPLPSRFGKPAYTFDSECFVNGVRMIPVSTSTTGPRRCDIQHICAQEPYTNFSIDELRLLERYRSFPEEAGSYASYVNRGFQPLGTATDNEQQPETEEQEECGRQLMDTTLDDEEDYERHLQAMLDHLVTNEQIPMPIPFPSFIEAEFLQLTLLNVLLIADKYCWDDLFNDAMDVYRKGEERLARPHPVLRHIELAYRHCPSSSPLVTLLADTAFYQGQANQSSSEMAEFGLVCKEFWEDVMARQEGKISVPGFNRYGGIRTSKSPLSRAGGTVYHRHGRNWNKGECPRSCEQRRRERL